MFVILAILALLVFVYWLDKHYNYWELRGIPHRKLTLVEKFNKLRSFNFPTTKEYRDLKHHGIFGFHLFIFPAIFVADPTIINDVLIRDFRNFFNRKSTIDRKIDPFGQNLFTLQDEEWKKARTLTSPAYVISNSKNPVAAAKIISENLLNYIEKKPVIEVHRLMKRVVIDFFALWTFTIDVNSIQNPNNDFFNGCNDGFFKEDVRVVWKTLILIFVPSLLKFFRLKSFGRNAEAFFRQLVLDMIELRKDPKNVRNDFFQFLIKLTETNKDFTDADVTAHILLTFFGGLETSISTLTFGLFELARNEEIQRRCQEEIEENTPQDGGEWTYENLKDMKYINAVIDETLRKYSPGIAVNRVCAEDTKIASVNLTIPKGTLVYISSLKVQRDPDIYDNPLEFRPERFLSSSKGTEVPGTPYLPFGLGHHICIGKPIAQNFIRVVLVHILKKFNLKLAMEDCGEISFKRKRINTAPSRDVMIEFIEREDH